jgi:hypothetical protein
MGTAGETRAAQLRLYEPEKIEAALRQAVNGHGGEYAAAVGMIRGTTYTLPREGSTRAAHYAERLEHIERILTALWQVTGPPDLADIGRRAAGLDEASDAA